MVLHNKGKLNTNNITTGMDIGDKKHIVRMFNNVSHTIPIPYYYCLTSYTNNNEENLYFSVFSTISMDLGKDNLPTCR